MGQYDGHEHGEVLPEGTAQVPARWCYMLEYKLFVTVQTWALPEALLRREAENGSIILSQVQRVGKGFAYCPLR